MSIPNVLVIAFSELHKDPRVSRQLEHLKSKGYSLTALGYTDPCIEDVKFLKLNFPVATKKSIYRRVRGKLKRLSSIKKLLTKRYEDYYWSQSFIIESKNLLRGGAYDLVIANDIESLPLAIEMGGNAKILFDAHEYAPREWEDSLLWRIIYQKYKYYLCKRYIPHAHRMVTVCQAIAEEYQKNFDVSSVGVIHNAPFREDLQPSPSAPDKIRMIYHGGAIPSRNIHAIVDAMKYLDKRYTLDLILLPGCMKYIKKIERSIVEDERIRLLPPQPMKQISNFSNQYDLGVYLLTPSSFNNTYAMPNKLFEFIQARLGVIVTPLPEMKKVIDTYQCGVTIDGYDGKALAESLKRLSIDDIKKFKNNSHKAAADLCAENSMKKLDEMILELLGN